MAHIGFEFGDNIRGNSEKTEPKKQCSVLILVNVWT